MGNTFGWVEELQATYSRHTRLHDLWFGWERFHSSPSGQDAFIDDGMWLRRQRWAVARHQGDHRTEEGESRRAGDVYWPLLAEEATSNLIKLQTGHAWTLLPEQNLTHNLPRPEAAEGLILDSSPQQRQTSCFYFQGRNPFYMKKKKTLSFICENIKWPDIALKCAPIYPLLCPSPSAESVEFPLRWCRRSSLVVWWDWHQRRQWALDAPSAAGTLDDSPLISCSSFFCFFHQVNSPMRSKACLWRESRRMKDC